jgi:hypothetical protein
MRQITDPEDREEATKLISAMDKKCLQMFAEKSAQPETPKGKTHAR